MKAPASVVAVALLMMIFISNVNADWTTSKTIWLGRGGSGGGSRTFVTTISTAGQIIRVETTNRSSSGDITSKTIEDNSYHSVNMLAKRTVTTFDNAGNITGRVVEVNSYDSSDDKLAKRTVTTFDKSGNIIGRHTVDNEYLLSPQPNGRVKVQLSRTVENWITYDILGYILRVTQAILDGEGNVTSIAYTENTYQARQWGKFARSLTKTDDYSSSGVVTGSATVEKLYDEYGHRLSSTVTTYNAARRVTDITKEAYDAWERLASHSEETFDPSAGSIGKTVTEYTYNVPGDGRMIRLPISKTITVFNNAAGLITGVTKIAYNEGTGKLISTTYKHHSYNDAGELIGIASSLYDEANILNSVSQAYYSAGTYTGGTAKYYYYGRTGSVINTVEFTYNTHGTIGVTQLDFDEITGKLIGKIVDTPHTFNPTTGEVASWLTKYYIGNFEFSQITINPSGPPTIQSLNNSSSKERGDKLGVINAARAWGAETKTLDSPQAVSGAQKPSSADGMTLRILDGKYLTLQGETIVGGVQPIRGAVITIEDAVNTSVMDAPKSNFLESPVADHAPTTMPALAPVEPTVTAVLAPAPATQMLSTNIPVATAPTPDAQKANTTRLSGTEPRVNLTDPLLAGRAFTITASYDESHTLMYVEVTADLATDVNGRATKKYEATYADEALTELISLRIIGDIKYDANGRVLSQTISTYGDEARTQLWEVEVIENKKYDTNGRVRKQTIITYADEARTQFLDAQTIEYIAYDASNNVTAQAITISGENGERLKHTTVENTITYDNKVDGLQLSELDEVPPYQTVSKYDANHKLVSKDKYKDGKLVSHEVADMEAPEAPTIRTGAEAINSDLDGTLSVQSTITDQAKQVQKAGATIAPQLATDKDALKDAVQK